IEDRRGKYSCPGSSYFENREDFLSELREFSRETKILLEAREKFFESSTPDHSLDINYLL
ncbi:MAG: hypothetical protein II308_08560, partial [Muribaculaceae bacterium]|nr:hypothetical protein [Muribaculaceae bacterium]